MRVRLWRRLSAEELMLLNCGVGEDSWESLGLQGDPTSPFWRRSALGFLWKDWCRSWNSSTLATSCEELTHWKRLWCWEGLGAGGEGDNRGWDGWMASWTRQTWVWVNSGSWWWTGRPGVLRFMVSQRVGHDWVTELNWTDSRQCDPFKIQSQSCQIPDLKSSKLLPIAYKQKTKILKETSKTLHNLTSSHLHFQNLSPSLLPFSTLLSNRSPPVASMHQVFVSFHPRTFAHSVPSLWNTSSVSSSLI